MLCEVGEVQIYTVSWQGAGSLCICKHGTGRARMLLGTTVQLMSTAAFLPSICEQLGKQAREDKGQLMSPVAVLLFNYYCFQIPLSIHSSIYVLIGPINNQKIETTKVGVCVLLAVPLYNCDKLSVANVLVPCGTWPLSASTFCAGSGVLRCESWSREENSSGESGYRVLWCCWSRGMLRHREVDAATASVSAAEDGDRGVETMQLLHQTVGEKLSTECLLK